MNDTKLKDLQQQKLAQDNKNYLNLLSGLPFPVWLRDADLNITYCNNAFGEFIDESALEDTMHLELHKNARDLAETAKLTGEKQNEKTHLIIGGKRRWMDIYEIPSGEGVLGYATDISDREKIQDDLKRTLEAQDDLLESSTGAMAIFGADQKLAAYNTGFSNLWGISPDFLERGPTFALFMEKLRELRKLPEQANFKTFKDSQVKLFSDLLDPKEEFLYLPDGKTLRVIAIPQGNGGLLFSYEDVTDRLALESSYNTLIEVQRETLDNLYEGIAVFGEDGKLRLYNPIYMDLWGFEQDFLKSKPHLKNIVDTAKPLYKYDDWENFKEQVCSALYSREFKTERFERLDGKFIDRSSVPLPDGGTLFTYFDVTDSILAQKTLEEKNEALEEADQLKTQFLKNMSYELRSPLTSISGFTEMLQSNYFGELNEKQSEYVKNIHSSTNYLRNLIDDILDVATMEAGFMDLQYSKFDVLTCANTVIERLDKRFKKFDMNFTFTHDSNLGEIEADEKRITQALFNILSNAIKFSEDGSKIDLNITDQGEQINFEIIDEGIGIPKNEQKKIFDKFFKGSKELSGGRKSGTGLGLSMVKDFIEMHGGQILLESEEGVGTKLAFSVPKVKKS